MTAEQDEKREAPRNGDLIWITEAMVTYKRSRGWFNARLADGRLHDDPQPGTAKIFLHRSEIEREISKEARG